jgi:hypothetical protein
MGVFEAVAIVAGIAGLYLFNLSKAASNLTYFPGDITGFSLAGFSPVITVDLVVQNTSNVEFTISSLAANVTSDGTLIGNVSNFSPVRIPTNSQGNIPLTLTLQPLGVVNDIISIITGGSGSRDILLQGSVNANGFQQPFTVRYKVGV